MQIHELDTYIGTPSETDFLAVDDGTETFKIPMTNVGITRESIRDFFYPVGSYFETSDTSFDPNTAWGGTWVKEVAGQVHVSAGTGYSVSGANTNTSDGGEKTHTLTVNEMPSHTHDSGGAYTFYGSGNETGTLMLWTDVTGTARTRATGGGQAHNIMQPYIVVNRWHRTA